VAEAQIATHKKPKAEKKLVPEDTQADERMRQQKKEQQLEKQQQDEAKAEKAREQQKARLDAVAKAEKLEKTKRQKAALSAQRQANLKRMLGQAAGESDSEGAAQLSSGPSAGYAGRIKARIKPNVTFTDPIEGNPRAVVEVRLAADGHIISSRIIQSSGVPSWDNAVLRAVEKTEVLPRDTDGRVPERMELAFRPSET
jgi:colicin import membrane protein